MMPTTSSCTSAIAAITAFWIARRFARPWATMQFPRRPRSGALSVRVVVEPCARFLQRGTYEQRTQLDEDTAAGHVLAQCLGDCRRRAFGQFEHHIADESVGDDDVGDVVENIFALDVCRLKCSGAVSSSRAASMTWALPLVRSSTDGDDRDAGLCYMKRLRGRMRCP